MFARFAAHYLQDDALSRIGGSCPLHQLCEPQLKEFFLRFGGMSFNNGLYRVMCRDAFEAGQAFIADGFPDFVGRVMAFAFDWLG